LPLPFGIGLITRGCRHLPERRQAADKEWIKIDRDWGSQIDMKFNWLSFSGILNHRLSFCQHRLRNLQGFSWNLRGLDTDRGQFVYSIFNWNFYQWKQTRMKQNYRDKMRCCKWITTQWNFESRSAYSRLQSSEPPRIFSESLRLSEL
jgi:hypothetical protein